MKILRELRRALHVAELALEREGQPTAAQLLALECVWRGRSGEGRACSRLTVAADLGLDKSTASRVVTRLVEMGLVTDHTSVNQHGIRRLQLTDDGHRALQIGRKAAVEVERELLRQLGKIGKDESVEA